MTNLDICNAAVRLSGELAPETQPDYLARSVSLLALVCTECLPLDDAYRAANGLEARDWSPRVSILLTDPFPLCDVFSAPAAYALAALLTLDENGELSAAMYARFASLLADIRRGLPAKSEPIADVYRVL